ncbi:MAG: hypothetical protein GPJ52_02775 [Candidatus Heimdallarchaeota archaeon]|nr:hypothetical protein [Candidatus Heimdallarchaeota archaeon]
MDVNTTTDQIISRAKELMEVPYLELQMDDMFWRSVFFRLKDLYMTNEEYREILGLILIKYDKGLICNMDIRFYDKFWRIINSVLKPRKNQKKYPNKRNYYNPNNEAINKRIKELKEDYRKTDREISNMAERYPKKIKTIKFYNYITGQMEKGFDFNYDPEDEILFKFYKLIKHKYWVKPWALRMWHNKLKFNELCEEYGHEYSKASIREMARDVSKKNLPNKRKIAEEELSRIKRKILVYLKIEPLRLIELKEKIRASHVKMNSALNSLVHEKKVRMIHLDGKYPYTLTDSYRELINMV